MTPNAAIVFAVIVIGAAMASAGVAGLAVLFVLCLAFGLVEVGPRLIRAAAWSAGIVLPLAAFMTLVWVGVVGRSPAEIAAAAPGTRAAALAHVLFICSRLFLVAFAIQLAALRFADLTPLEFIRRVTAPPLLKKLLVLTLSLVDTILHAVDRARTALVAAGIIAARASFKNVANGWILVQTVWLSVITIAIGRVRDKWPVENTLARLDGVLAACRAPPLTAADWAWMAAALAAAVVAIGIAR